ncbi:helix-turn-helix domain-containing protein [Methanobrevibacter sp.]
MIKENNVWKIHITNALSSKRIIELIDEYPSLKLITCSKSLYDRIPQKYLEALEQLDIEVKIEYNPGVKPKFSNEFIDKVIELKKEGLSPREISQNLDITTKQVYYILEKYSDIKLKGHKRKYSDKLKEEVRQLKNEGLSVKDISNQTNIPVRTIYYILNNK